MGLIILVIVGAAAGFIASRMMGRDLPLVTTIALGVAGAAVGWAVLRFLLVIGGMMGGFVGAVIGAALILWIYQRYFEDR